MKHFSKTLAILAVLCLQVVPAMAGATLSIQGQKVASGQTYTIEVAMENDEPIDAISGTLTLPEGLTYVANSFKLSDRASSDFNATYVPSTKKFSVINYGTAKSAAGSGTIFTFQVKTGTLTGDVDIEISKISISNAAGTNVATATTAKGTLTSVGNELSLEADPKSMELQAGDEATVSLVLTSPAANVGASMRIKLPKGLQMVEGSETKGEMLASSHTISMQYASALDAYNVVIISPLNDAFVSAYAELFSFKVKAVAAISASSAITVSNIGISTKSGYESSLDDITISVKADAAEYTLSATPETVELEGTTEATVSLKATCPLPKTGAQMTITVPANVEIVEGSAVKGDLLTDHIVNISKTTANENIYNVLVFSGSNADFTSQEDVLFTFNVKATGEVAEGAQITISNILFSDKSGTEDAAANVTIAVSYTSAEPVVGDVDNDGVVTLDDLNKFLVDNKDKSSLPTEGEAFVRYDANGDGKISIADAQAIVNLARGKNADGSKK